MEEGFPKLTAVEWAWLKSDADNSSFVVDLLHMLKWVPVIARETVLSSARAPPSATAVMSMGEWRKRTTKAWAPIFLSYLGPDPKVAEALREELEMNRFVLMNDFQYFMDFIMVPYLWRIKSDFSAEHLRIIENIFREVQQYPQIMIPLAAFEGVCTWLLNQYLIIYKVPSFPQPFNVLWAAVKSQANQGDIAVAEKALDKAVDELQNKNERAQQTLEDTMTDFKLRTAGAEWTSPITAETQTVDIQWLIDTLIDTIVGFSLINRLTRCTNKMRAPRVSACRFYNISVDNSKEIILRLSANPSLQTPIIADLFAQIGKALVKYEKQAAPAAIHAFCTKALIDFLIQFAQSVPGSVGSNATSLRDFDAQKRLKDYRTGSSASGRRFEFQRESKAGSKSITDSIREKNKSSLVNRRRMSATIDDVASALDGTSLTSTLPTPGFSFLPPAAPTLISLPPELSFISTLGLPRFTKSSFFDGAGGAGGAGAGSSNGAGGMAGAGSGAGAGEGMGDGDSDNHSDDSDSDDSDDEYEVTSDSVGDYVGATEEVLGKGDLGKLVPRERHAATLQQGKYAPLPSGFYVPRVAKSSELLYRNLKTFVRFNQLAHTYIKELLAVQVPGHAPPLDDETYALPGHLYVLPETLYKGKMITVDPISLPSYTSIKELFPKLHALSEAPYMQIN